MKAFSRSKVTDASDRTGTPKVRGRSRARVKSRWRSRARPPLLARAEGLEGDDGVGVLDARDHLHLLVDEMADIGVVVDVELDQEIVVAGCGIDLRGDFG